MGPAALISGQASLWAPGRVNVSETAAGHARTLFDLEPRGPIVATHDRSHEMIFRNRLKPEFSRDADGRGPNPNFEVERNRLLSGFRSWMRSRLRGKPAKN